MIYELNVIQYINFLLVFPSSKQGAVTDLRMGPFSIIILCFCATVCYSIRLSDWAPVHRTSTRSLHSDVKEILRYRYSICTLILLPFLILYCISGDQTSHVLLAFYSIGFAIKCIGSLHSNAKYLSACQIFSDQDMNSSTQKCTDQRPQCSRTVIILLIF
jgi:hypothetical protein